MPILGKSGEDRGVTANDVVRPSVCQSFSLPVVYIRVVSSSRRLGKPTEQIFPSSNDVQFAVGGRHTEEQELAMIN